MAAEEGLRRAPDKPETLTAAGMAAYRHGDLSKAEAYYLKAFKLDPHYAGSLGGLATIYSAISKFKTERKFVLAAYHSSKDDPQLITAYGYTLEGAEHTAALERALAIYDPTSREARALRAHIANDKEVGDRKLRRLSTPYQHYQINLVEILAGPRRAYAVGLQVQLNQSHKVRLMLDTGASGIAVAPKVAEKAGLEILGSESFQVYGAGDEKAPESFHYVAGSVSMGGLSFTNFPVSVFRTAQTTDYDGLIGADVFRRFLVTIDFPRLRLDLDTRPESLPADHAEPEDAVDPLPSGFFRALRFGNHLTVPTSVNESAGQLFLIDSGSNVNLIDTAVAGESTSVHADNRSKLRGIQGQVKDVSRASEVSLIFAGFHQRNSDLLAVDMSKLDDAAGVGIAGVLGIPVLRYMKLTIDYKNGAVRFEYQGRL